MSTSFVTPGRRSGSAPTSSGSSSKRVVRSALEVLLDTASPEIGMSARRPPPAPSRETRALPSPSPRQPSQPVRSPAAAHGNAGFTVTYAAAAPEARTVSLPPPAVSTRTRRGELREEPSALAFLSPKAKRETRAHSAGERAPTAAGHGSHRPRGALPPQQYTAPLTTAVTVSSPPETSRNLYEEVEQASQEGVGRRRKSVSFSSTHTDSASETASHSSRLSDTSTQEPLYTEDQLMERIEETLTAYEQRRDDEETTVLEKVAEEIESHKARYEALLRKHEAALATNDDVASRLAQSEAYARTLEQKLSALHAANHAERERTERLEVTLRHAQDAQRASTSPYPLASPAARASAERLAELEAQLVAKAGQVSTAEARIAALEAEAARHTEEKQQFALDCEAIKSRVVFFSERMAEMETVLREKNAQLQRTQRQLADVKGELQHVRRQAAETAIATGPPSPSTAQRLADLEANLQQQTDEVRRRMHRTAVLEQEKAALADETQRLRQALCAAVTHQKRIDAELDGVTRLLRLYTRKPQQWLETSATGGRHAHRTNTTRTDRRSASDSPPSRSRLSLDETQSFANDSPSSFHLSPSTSSNSSETDDVSDNALHTPRSQNRARSSPTTTLHDARSAKRSHRARTVSPRTTHPSGRKAAATAVTKAQTKEALHELAACQSASLLAARDVARALTSLRATTQSYVRRLRRKHEKLLATSATATAPSGSAVPAALATSAKTAAAASPESAVLTLRKLEDACRTLKAALEAKSSELEEVRTECQLRGEDLRLLERHAQALQTELDSRAAQCDEATASAAKSAETVATLRESLATTQSALEDRTRECADGSTAMQALRNELSEAERTMRQRAGDWQDKLAALATEKKRLEEAKAALEAELAECRQRTAELHSQLQALRSQQAGVRLRGGREQRELAQDLSLVRQQLASVTALHEANKAQLEKERADFAARESQSQRQAERLQAKLKSLKQELLQLGNEHELRCVAEHGTLTTLLDMLQPYSTATAHHEVEHGLFTGGTRLFHSPSEGVPGDDTDSEAGVHREAVALHSTTPSPVQTRAQAVPASLAQLTKCRSEVVCRVQRVLLEVARLTLPHAAPPRGVVSPDTRAPRGGQGNRHARSPCNDDKELILHNCSYQEEASVRTPATTAEEREEEGEALKCVDDDLLGVLQACCGGTASLSSPRDDRRHVATGATSRDQLASRGHSPQFLHERSLNAPPPLSKLGKAVQIPTAQAREPHAHLLRVRGEDANDSSSLLTGALQSKLLQNSPSVFAP